MGIKNGIIGSYVGVLACVALSATIFMCFYFIIVCFWKIPVTIKYTLLVKSLSSP